MICYTATGSLELLTNTLEQMNENICKKKKKKKLSQGILKNFIINDL